MKFVPARRWLAALILLAGQMPAWTAPAAAIDNAEVKKLPGIISLNPGSQDEEVAIDALFGGSPHGAPDCYVAIVELITSSETFFRNA